jgi:hypothetical protein
MKKEQLFLHHYKYMRQCREPESRTFHNKKASAIVDAWVEQMALLIVFNTVVKALKG